MTGRLLSYRQTALALASVSVFFVAVFSPLVGAQDVTRGYLTDAQLQNGMIVRLSEKDRSKVDVLPADKIRDMLGVIVPAGDSPVTVSTVGDTQQVYVATYGRYGVLVSNQNGAIKAGDYITISSIAGVGMKADDNQAIIIGKATEGFDGETNAEGDMALSVDGRNQTVTFRRIPVDVAVGHNPLYMQDSDGIPAALQKAARLVTSRPVSPLRLYAALVIFVVCLLLAGGLLVTGVRSSMIAIGRNPLAKPSILRGLLQVVLVAIIVAVLGLIGVYLLLKV